MRRLFPSWVRHGGLRGGRAVGGWGCYSCASWVSAMVGGVLGGSKGTKRSDDPDYHHVISTPSGPTPDYGLLSYSPDWTMQNWTDRSFPPHWARNKYFVHSDFPLFRLSLQADILHIFRLHRFHQLFIYYSTHSSRTDALRKRKWFSTHTVCAEALYSICRALSGWQMVSVHMSGVSRSRVKK